MDARSTLKLTLAATVALGLAIAAPVQAISQDFAFELTTVDVDLLGTGLQPGDVLQGNFSHSSCLNNVCDDYSIVSATSGIYYGVTISLDLMLGGFQAQSNSYDTDIYVTNGAQYDQYWFTTYYGVGDGSISPSPTTILGETVDYVNQLETTATLILGDPDHSAFASGALPAQLPPLGVFEEMSFELHVYLDYWTDSGWRVNEVFGATAVLPQALPEPSTGLLLGSGLAIALGVRRRSATD